MDYYKILQVPNDATLKEINKNFKELSSRYHPDKNPDDKYSEEKMKLITEAYSIISNYDKRVEYDEKIQLINNTEEKIIPINKDSKLIDSFDLMFESKQFLLADKSNSTSENKKKETHTFF